MAKIIMRNKAKGLVVALAVVHGEETVVTNSVELMAEATANDLRSGDRQAIAHALSLMELAIKKGVLETELALLVPDPEE